LLVVAADSIGNKFGVFVIALHREAIPVQIFSLCGDEPWVAWHKILGDFSQLFRW
jgi:hypothetical protein